MTTNPIEAMCEKLGLDCTPTGGLGLPRWKVALRGASACLVMTDKSLTPEFRKSVSEMLGAHQSAIDTAATMLRDLQRQVEGLEAAFKVADRISCAAIEHGFYAGDGLLEQLAEARATLKDNTNAR